MKILSYPENLRRGTPDFPVELHIVDENHPRYQMQFHWHSDIEIIYVVRGILHLTLNDLRFELQAGESVIVPGGVVHGATATGCEYICIVFSKSILYATSGVKSLIKSKFLHPVHFEENDDIKELLESLRASNREMLVQMSMIYKIMDMALKKQDGSNIISEEKIDRIKPAIVYIEDNYQSRICVDELAKECLMSSSYFIKCFREKTGQTPVEFLNKYRIEVACEMLLAGNSVTETAFECGFNDLSYFINMFKKEKGISPKKYAMKARKNSF